MRLLERVRDKLIGGYVGLGLGASGFQDHNDMVEEAMIKAQEMALTHGEEKSVREALGLGDIELALEDVSWRDLSSPNGSGNFSRIALRRMMALSRIMTLVNPLIKRALTVQELYVWGSGCNIKAEDPIVQEVIDDCFNDPKNQSVIGESWPEREKDQRTDGNLFFIFFINRIKGTVRIRLLPVDQVEDIISNPDDSKEPRYYKRSMVQAAVSDTDPAYEQFQGDHVYYPSIDYNPFGQQALAIDGIPIRWDARILHVKTGGLSSMKFGMPEMFAGLNWATAYKKILENFATILAAYARVAMQIKGNAGKKGVAAGKSQLNTKLNANNQLVDTNPPTNVASWFLGSGNVELSAVKTAHSTTGPDEARALRSMVAAATDTPEHFFGDSDIGNFATSTTLDRPTELKMIARQTMWANVIQHMIRAILDISASSYNGKLKAAGFSVKSEYDRFDGTTIRTLIVPKDIKIDVAVTFPPILEREMVQRVRAVVQAATLGGSKAEGIIPNRKLLFKLLMEALGRKDADKLTEELYPEDVVQGFQDPKELEEDQIEIAKIKAKGFQDKKDSGGPNLST